MRDCILLKKLISLLIIFTLVVHPLAASAAYTQAQLAAIEANAVIVETYKYDQNGNRTEKSTYDDNGNWVQTVTFVDGYMDSIKTSNGQTEVIHISGPGGRIASITQGEIAFYHKDHLGSTDVMTNIAGTKIEDVTYDPHGQIVTDVKMGTTKNSKSYYFTGKYLDTKTGLVYFGARYLDPATARFLTPDSIIQDFGDSQAFNRYLYARNNPVNAIDGDGHFFNFIVMAIAHVVSTLIAASVAHPIIMGAALAGAASEVNSLSHGQNFAQAYVGAIGPTLIGGAIGGLTGAMPAKAGPLKWAAAGSAVGGVGALASGGNVGQGFLNGAIAGAAMWAGGDIMAQKFAGAGLLGNVISSGGMSVIENSLQGKPGFSRYQIYLGPLSVTLSGSLKPQFGLSSVSNLFFFGKGVFGPGKFDAWQTLSSGTPVFHTEYGGEAGRFGRTRGNNIFLGPGGDSTGRSVTGHNQWVLGHERIHANIQGRLGGAWGASDAVSLISNSTQNFGSVADGSARQVPTMGWANENAFEIQAADFGLWGQ